MSEKDVAQKNFEFYNDIAADIVNGSLSDIITNKKVREVGCNEFFWNQCIML